MEPSSDSDDNTSANGDSGNEPRSNARVVLSAWLCSGAMIAYLCRNSLGVAEKTIRLDLGISEESMGFVMGSFFWAYALCQIPGGLLGKKFGSRIWLPVFAAFSALATMTFGMAAGVASLLTARIGIGVEHRWLPWHGRRWNDRCPGRDCQRRLRRARPVGGRDHGAPGHTGSALSSGRHDSQDGREGSR